MAQLAEAAELLRPARRVWLGTHHDPDGDAIGSLLGLGWLLRARGVAVSLSCQDPPPTDLAFLPGIELIGTDAPARPDVAVALDAGDFDRLGSIVSASAWAALPTIVIDHHASNPGFGRINVIAPDASSTAELVLQLAEAMASPVNRDAATCLLAGLVTDTLGFRTSNTSPQSLRSAAVLMDQGAPLHAITQAVFASRPLAGMRLIGRALERLEVRDGIGLTCIGPQDFGAVGARSEQGRGLSNFLITIRELRAVAVLRQDSDGEVDVSMRSRAGVDLGPVAQSLGGGGHAQAAGAHIAGPLAKAAQQVWSALAAATTPGDAAANASSGEEADAL